MRSVLSRLVFGAAVTAVGGLAWNCGTYDAPQGPPNIIVVLADDMGYGDVGVYNPQSRIPTPHMDRLAAEGVMFERTYSTTSWTLPSQASMMTGLYPSSWKWSARWKSWNEK